MGIGVRNVILLIGLGESEGLVLFTAYYSVQSTEY